LTEFSEYGDLYQFLRSHAPVNNNNLSSGSGSSKGHYSNASGASTHTTRVARVFWVKHTKKGKIYQMAVK
jgi:membrane carboxypeptidase/penicillin-binding protein PbpC